MTPTIERAAQHCYEYDFNGSTAPKWQVMKDHEKEPFRKRAIDILETLLEPSDKEVEVAMRAYLVSRNATFEGIGKPPDLSGGFYDDIRAALRAAALARLGR